MRECVCMSGASMREKQKFWHWGFGHAMVTFRLVFIDILTIFHGSKLCACRECVCVRVLWERETETERGGEKIREKNVCVCVDRQTQTQVYFLMNIIPKLLTCRKIRGSHTKSASALLDLCAVELHANSPCTAGIRAAWPTSLKQA